MAKFDNTRRVNGGLEHEAYLWHDLKSLIDEAGGKERLLACGHIFSGPFQIQMVAYELGIHGIDVGWKETPAPGVVFRTRTVPDGPLVTKPTDDRFRLVEQDGKWRLLTVPPAGDARRLSRRQPEHPDRPGSVSRSLGSPGWQASPHVPAPCPGSARSRPASSCR